MGVIGQCTGYNLGSLYVNMLIPDTSSMQQYTFILTASKELPKQCIRNRTAAAKYAVRKNVGVRMPDDAICQAILENTDAPLISTR